MHAVVEGTVQGVGFRYFVHDTAVALGLTGWVRNLWDGTVEVMAEGERQGLEKLYQALQRGPRGAEVMGVQHTWEKYRGEDHGFHIRQTSI
jgi:acylphosphatase